MGEQAGKRPLVVRSSCVLTTYLVLQSTICSTLRLMRIQNHVSMYIRSDVDVVVQYGRMDVNQDNLAYMVTMGYGE